MVDGGRAEEARRGDSAGRRDGRRARSSREATALRIAAGLALLGGATVLTGCADPGAGGPSPSAVAETPAASPAPTMSDEEALRIAEETYRAYMEAETNVTESGDDPGNLLSTVTTDAYRERNDELIAHLQQSGQRSRGQATVDSFRLISIEGDVMVRISFYHCVDYSQYRIVDLSGNDVTPVDRPHRVSMKSEVDNSEGSFKVSGGETWPGDNFC